jgi:uncharacterized protein (TIGR03000 family)
LEVKMFLYSSATSRLAVLAVAALLLMGKTAMADQSQPGPGEPDQAVHFAVTVPAGAEIWFDGVKADQKGPYREFVSPPIRLGHHYYYDVRVRWRDGERELDRTRHVTFNAGDQVNLDFTPDRVQARYSYYAPSSTIEPPSSGSNYAPRRRLRSLSAQDPTLGRWRTSGSGW